MRTVEPSTAGQPPPRDLSSTIGSVSFVITLLNKRVTKTQCFPRCNSLRTLAACLLSAPSPEVLMTWRYISSYVLSASNSAYVDMSRTCPISAMVNPAKAPPNSTRAAATPRYSQRLAFCGDLVVFSSLECTKFESPNGAA
jgi:hypothetical protein